MEHDIKRALNGKGKSKTHTHGVHYERASNGGYIAHVHKHHGKGPHSEGMSHVEEHALPDKEAVAEHFDEHMGDQPGYGEEMAQAAPAEPAEEQGGEPQPMA
jgi:hypothetical protein